MVRGGRERRRVEGRDGKREIEREERATNPDPGAQRKGTSKHDGCE